MCYYNDVFFPCGIDLVAAFSCPSNQYLYTGCSTCFAASSDLDMDFGAASDYCKSGGGNLITFGSSDDISRLGRFLEGLGEESHGLWVGLRFTSSGMIVDADGVGSSVVNDSSNFAPGDTGTGSDTVCIGIREGRFFTRACSTLQRFICTYTYSSEYW